MSESISDFTEFNEGFLTASPWARRISRRLVVALLTRLRWGQLRLVEELGDDGIATDPPTQVHTFGTLATAAGEEPLLVEVRVHDGRFFSKLAFGGSIGVAEAYMAGYWSTDNLTGVLSLVLRHRELLTDMEKGWARLVTPFRWLFQALRANTRDGSRRNIVAHYDLGNDFFRLFLDQKHLMYSCAIFDPENPAPPAESLEEAAEAKLDRICRKLELSPNDHVLEIGTGWGGFAVYAAQNYGCRVTTTTISPAQYEYACARVEESGLGERITVLRKDYRDLEGQFDKLVSIEMIEAVGHQYIPTFFKVCSDRLKPDGLMLLQAITIADRFYEQAKNTVDFIKRYIFPGAGIPSIGSMTTALVDVTDLRLVHLEDIGPHYADTLLAWRQRFLAHQTEVGIQGFSGRFIRMWEYYFCYCEAGFRERTIGDAQLLMAKPLNRKDSLLGDLA